MAETTRRVLGGAVAVVCLAVAWGVSAQLEAAARGRAEAEARQQLSALVTPAEERLRARRESLEKIARSGSQRLDKSLENLPPEELERSGGPAELVKTIVDVLQQEGWWASFREAGESVLVVKLPAGDGSGTMTWTVASEVPEAAREGLIALAQQAEVAGIDSGFLRGAAGPLVASAVRLTLPATQHQQYVLVLQTRLTEAALLADARALNAALALKVGDALLVSGETADAAALHAFLDTSPSSGGASSSSATRELAPGVLMAVGRDVAPRLAEVAAASGRTRLIALAIGGVLGALAVALTFRRSRSAERDRLLQETAAQLQAQREQLERITQRLTSPAVTGAPAPVDSMADALAATSASAVPSRYEVVAPLGQGGMAQVSLAVVRGAEGFRRMFVLKRLRPELTGTQELVSQFIDEARLGASLVHSNVVPVFDFGRDTEGYYMAQEYILGRDVDAVVQASLKRRSRPLEAPLVLAIAQEALKALSYAHGKADDAGRALGLVHRDVSPNNLMLSARGEVKLLDFGIVKSEQRLTKTQTGIVKGNLFFMSPEQAKALPVDARSDLYSLAMSLYFAAAGDTLYSGGSSYELLTRAAQGLGPEDVARVRALGEPLAGVLLKALQFDPAARYLDADEFARAVAATGQVASAADLKLLMETLLKDELAEEQSRFAVREGA
jgi:hypothetical protein